MRSDLRKLRLTPRIFNITIIIFIVCILSSCTTHTSRLVTPLTTNNSNWIQSTSPKDGEQDVSSVSNIAIFFNKDIDPSTLNENHLTIIEGKHSHSIIKLFSLNYDKQERKLILNFNSDYGSSNGLDITISGHIRNMKGEEMGEDYHFGFSTK
jgi:hypothetical protein